MKNMNINPSEVLKAINNQCVRVQNLIAANYETPDNEELLIEMGALLVMLMTFIHS